MRGDSFEHYIDMIRERIDRVELWRRLPTGWESGKAGGPSWASSAEHVRPAEPKFYARRIKLFTFAATARFHYAEGDPRLRRISIIVDPISTMGHGPAGELVALLLSLASHATGDKEKAEHGEPWFRVHGEISHTEAGPEVVVDIEAIIPPEPSMEEFFVYHD